MREPVVAEVTIAAPPAVVWRALRDPREIARWHGWEHDALEAEIATIYLDGIEVDERARSFETGAGRFEVEDRGAATIVRVRRAPSADTVSADGSHDEIDEGWLTFLQQLRYYLERHAGAPRRTRVLRRRIPTPAGDPWFTSAHQQGIELDERTLVVITPDRTIVSGYGVDPATLDRLTARLAGDAPG